MKKYKISFLTNSLLFLAVITMSSPFRAQSHEGHDHLPGDDDYESSSGTIVISEDARKNLDIETAEAEIRVIDKVITVIGQVEPIPSHSAAITSRISGRVHSIKVLEGQSVKKGEPLVEVESRQLGDPPPRVEYKSPIDGVVIDRHAVLGDTVEPDKHLLKVIDLSEVYVEGQIHEGQIAKLRNGQKVRIKIESYPGETFQGVVEVISGALDPESRTLKVWSRVLNPTLKLRPNMRATLSILTGSADPVIAIPNESVLGDAGEFFSFVETEGNRLEFRKQPVVLGERDDRFVEIREGILPGDKVVTTGNYQLQYIKPVAKEKEHSDH